MFEHLKALNVSDKTATVDLPEISPDAKIHVKIADESNKPYFNALLKVGAERAKKQMRRGNDLDPGILAENRKLDAQLFPKHVMAGWEGVTDPEGNEIPFSEEAATELVAVLMANAQWVFDKIRATANTPSAFVDWDEMEPPTEDLVGNSESV